jgi:hypothetical protein
VKERERELEATIQPAALKKQRVVMTVETDNNDDNMGKRQGRWE